MRTKSTLEKFVVTAYKCDKRILLLIFSKTKRDKFQPLAVNIGAGEKGLNVQFVEQYKSCQVGM